MPVLHEAQTAQYCFEIRIYSLFVYLIRPSEVASHLSTSPAHSVGLKPTNPFASLIHLFPSRLILDTGSLQLWKIRSWNSELLKSLDSRHDSYSLPLPWRLTHHSRSLFVASTYWQRPLTSSISTSSDLHIKSTPYSRLPFRVRQRGARPWPQTATLLPEGAIKMKCGGLMRWLSCSQPNC
jgi:hypothetical protein